MAEPITKEQLIDASQDAETLEQVVNGDNASNVTSREGRIYPTLAKALYEVIQTGGFEPFLTEAALLASVPTVPKKAAKALDTKKIWYWDGSSWINTGLSELDQAKQYSDENKARFTSVNIATNPVITEAVAKYNAIALWGTLTADTTVVFPKRTATYVLRNVATVGTFKVKVKTDEQTVTALEIPAGASRIVHNTGTEIFEVDSDKISANSPVFTGSPKAPTPVTTSNDTSIATTKFVNDIIQYGDAALISIAVANSVDGELVITSEQYKRNLFIVSGALTSDITIVLPSAPRKEIWIQNSTSGNFALKVKTDTQVSSATVLPKGNAQVRSLGSGCYVGYDEKANLASPTFTGSPKSPTPVPTSNDLSIATSQFVRTSTRGVLHLDINDNTTTLDDLGYRVLRLVGSLTVDVTLAFAVQTGQWIIVNDTSGGKNVFLKGPGQNSAFVKVESGKAEDIYIHTGVARKIPYSAASGSALVPATPNTLGGIKVGSGLSIGSDGTLSAQNQSSISLQYVGKFKQGSNYLAGQVVEHGSGLYEVKVDVLNVDTPFNNGNFNKLQHNLYAGPNRELTVLSNTYEQVSAISTRPTYMSRDGMICFNNNTQTLKISYDFGKTWPHIIHDAGAGSWLRWTKELDDGELLISTTTVVSGQPYINKVLKSTDWNKGKNLTPTWEVVKQIQKEGVIYAGAWSVNSYRNYVLLAEYGGKNTIGGTFSEDYPRYCYLSTDYGKTFTEIFDLGDYTDGIGVHLHGVAFDPWWNRIWLSHGDGSGGTNGLYYSDDLGKTWTSGTQFNNPGPNFPQSVAIIPMPTCILFASDSYPNGMQRIDRAQGRIPHKGYYNIEIGYAIPEQVELLNHIIKGVYKADWLPDSPLVFCWAAESRAGKSGCALTFDGWNFQEIWVSDVISEPSFGLETVVGPTPENTLIFSGSEKVDGVTVNFKRTIKISVD